MASRLHVRWKAGDSDGRNVPIRLHNDLCGIDAKMPEHPQLAAVEGSGLERADGGDLKGVAAIRLVDEGPHRSRQFLVVNPGSIGQVESLRTLLALQEQLLRTVVPVETFEFPSKTNVTPDGNDGAIQLVDIL